VLLAFATGASACGDDGESSSTTIDADEEEAVSRDPGYMTAAEFGEAWPLTVDSGTVACEGSEGVGLVTFTAPDGTVYAVNGLAQGFADGRGWHDIEAIWRADPAVASGSVRIDIGPILDRGLELCA
jgi:hypothetical protein